MAEKSVNIKNLGERTVFTVDYPDFETKEYKREPSVGYSQMIAIKTDIGFGVKVFAHIGADKVLVDFS